MRVDSRATRARRDLAMTRPELRGAGHLYFDASERMPDEGRRCIGRAVDGNGAYELPFAIRWEAGAWWNNAFHRKLEIKIVKWRYA